MSFMAVSEHSQIFFFSFCPYKDSLFLLPITGKFLHKTFPSLTSLSTAPCHRQYTCVCSLTSLPTVPCHRQSTCECSLTSLPSAPCHRQCTCVCSLTSLPTAPCHRQYTCVCSLTSPPTAPCHRQYTCVCSLTSLPTAPCHRQYTCECSLTSVMSDPLWPHGQQPTRLLCPLGSPGKNTGVGCHALLQGIFLTQGSNLRLLHCRQVPYCWAPGKPS